MFIFLPASRHLVAIQLLDMCLWVGILPVFVFILTFSISCFAQSLRSKLSLLIFEFICYLQTLPPSVHQFVILSAMPLPICLLTSQTPFSRFLIFSLPPNFFALPTSSLCISLPFSTLFRFFFHQTQFVLYLLLFFGFFHFF